MEDLFLSMIVAIAIMGAIWFLACLVVLLFQTIGGVTALLIVLFVGLTTVTYLWINL